MNSYRPALYRASSRDSSGVYTNPWPHSHLFICPPFRAGRPVLCVLCARRPVSVPADRFQSCERRSPPRTTPLNQTRPRASIVFFAPKTLRVVRRASHVPKRFKRSRVNVRDTREVHHDGSLPISPNARPVRGIKGKRHAHGADCIFRSLGPRSFLGHVWPSPFCQQVRQVGSGFYGCARTRANGALMVRDVIFAKPGKVVRVSRRVYVLPP